MTRENEREVEPTVRHTTWPAWNGVRPLDWYLLMDEAEFIRTEHHLGLCSVWMHIDRGDYRRARRNLDRAVAGIRRREKSALRLASPTTAPVSGKVARVRAVPPSHPDCGRCRAELTNPTT